MEVALVDAPEPPSRLPSNWLSADSVARLVSAATVDARLAVRFPAELALLLVLEAVLAEVARPAAGLLLTLPIDTMTPVGTATVRVIGLGAEELEEERPEHDKASPTGRRTRATRGSRATSLRLRTRAPRPADHRPHRIPAPGWRATAEARRAGGVPELALRPSAVRGRG